MESIFIVIIIYLKSFIEFAGYLVIGQGLTYLLCFGKHKKNTVYKIFLFLTDPLYKIVALIIPKSINAKHIPYYTLLILFLSWLLLVIGKVISNYN
ncbi:MAG: hypothetical protein CBC01_01545 [Betaproteobacteria bacterium TMED41]|nr:MAG: hypothetical protein CBC01_01545 [Betaproteobacteria bacterium TMED41]|tara:strand:- start:656 stop:943 length:288 start_codon:yes stop_codon:yes gene_type:complete